MKTLRDENMYKTLTYFMLKKRPGGPLQKPLGFFRLEKAYRGHSL